MRVDLRVDFAESFRKRLRVLEEFMLAQDVDSRPAGVEDLEEEVLRLVDLVKLTRRLAVPQMYLMPARSKAKGGRSGCCTWPSMQDCLNFRNTSCVHIWCCMRTQIRVF